MKSFHFLCLKSLNLNSIEQYYPASILLTVYVFQMMKNLEKSHSLHFLVLEIVAKVEYFVDCATLIFKVRQCSI